MIKENHSIVLVSSIQTHTESRLQCEHSWGNKAIFFSIFRWTVFLNSSDFWICSCPVVVLSYISYVFYISLCWPSTGGLQTSIIATLLTCQSNPTRTSVSFTRSTFLLRSVVLLFLKILPHYFSVCLCFSVYYEWLNIKNKIFRSGFGAGLKGITFPY